MKKILSVVLVVLLIVFSVPNHTGLFNLAVNAADANENILKINNADELRAFAARVNGGMTYQGYSVELTADIDLKEKAWEPIGYNFNNYFAGSFDGKNFKISNIGITLSINASNIINSPMHTVGLFGMCNGASVSNVVLENIQVGISNESGYKNEYSSIDGTNVYAGSVCGYASSSTFTNITLRNTTVSAYTGGEAGKAIAGGIVGYARNGVDISYCAIETGSISGTSNSNLTYCVAGGIVGEMLNDGSVMRCSNLASVNGGHSISAAYTGGICGKTSSETNNTTLSIVKDCYNKGNVLHTGSWLESGYVGGIAGYSYGSVVNCYSAAVIKANTNTVGGSVYVAGIVGNGASSSVVENCANICSNISGGTNRYMIAGGGNKSNNVSLSSITGSPTKDATSTYGNSEFTNSTVFMGYLGWDFTSVWQQSAGDLPVLIANSIEQSDDLAIVNEAISLLEIIYSEGDTYLTVKNNITFSPSPNSAVVKWTSSNGNVITNDGVVTRKSEDTQVKITATVSSGDCVLKKVFVLNVLGTTSSETVESQDWAMDVDSARSLVALMRDCKIKDVSVYDESVQVLIGNNTDEDAIASFMVDFMVYLEVPGESDFLKSNMGDVIDLINTGADQEFSKLVLDFSDGLVAGDGSINETTVAKKMIAIPQTYYNGTRLDWIGSYKSIKDAADFSNDENASVYEKTKDGCTKMGKVLGCITKATGSKINPSKLLSNAFSAFEMWELYKAYNISVQNATKSYIKQYLDLRERYNKDSVEFQLLMDAAAVTSIKTDVENIDEFCETLYTVYDKLTYNVDDEYKVVIKCPVDVYVYDGSGNIVGRVVNNQVDHSIANALLISIGGENNDEKTIYIQDNDDYSVKLVGSDSGSMEVEVAQLSGDRSYAYEDIPLEVDKEMFFEISSEDLQKEEKDDIVLLKDGVYTENTESVDSQDVLHNLKIFVCEEDVYGNISLNTFGIEIVDVLVAEGTDISSYLTLGENCSLVGYYTDIDCTEPYQDLIMPASDIKLYAKCLKCDDKIRITKQPQDINSVVGSDDIVLDFSVSATIGYTIQWYKKTLDSTASVIYGANAKNLVINTRKAENAYYYAVLTGNDGTVVRTTGANVVIKDRSVTDSGNCGENLTWELFENDELIISGTGAMYTYSSGSAPWFKYSSTIETLTLSDGITTISSYSFEGFSSLKTLVIPNSVTEIEEYALSGCTSLNDITIPFVGSSRNANSTYDAVLGHIFGRVSAGTKQYFCLDSSTLQAYQYDIPDSLKFVTVTDADIIPFGAFHNCKNIKEITLNDGINILYGYAFSDVDSITKITIPNSVDTIEESVFEGSDSLVSLTIPFVGSSRTASDSYDSVLGYIFGRTEEGVIQYHKIEGNSVYYYNYAIPASLNEVIITDDVNISTGAFHNCTNIKSITLNEGIESIGGYAFANMTGLTELTIPNSVVSIAEYALKDCNAIQTLVIPFVGSNRHVSGSYDSVLGYIFGRANNTVTQYFTLSDGYLSGYGFAIPDSLKKVVVTDDSVIAFGAFSNCTMLSTIELEKATNAIENCAFFGISSIDRLAIKNPDCNIYNSSNCIGVSGTMYGYIGSTAEMFADAYGVTFVPIFFEITDTSKVVIDEDEKIIYIYSDEISSLSDFMTWSSDTNVEIQSEYNSLYIGTGTLINVTGSGYNDTFTCVVEFDSNGDGVCDTLDASYVALVSNGYKTATGVYMSAIDSNFDDVVDVNDYQAIVNRVVA